MNGSYCVGFLGAIHPCWHARDWVRTHHRRALENSRPWTTITPCFRTATVPIRNKTDNTNEQSEGKDNDTLIPSFDPLLITTDVFAIAMACQLMGLIDVLNDPTFWDSGGWLQPVVVPTTLPTFIQRFSINTVLFIAVPFVFRTGANQSEIALASSKSVRTTMLQTIAIFTLIRVVVGLSIILLLRPSSDDNSILDLLGTVTMLLRECYFVGITTTTGRYVYQKLLQNI
jgi:hypothetical protein